MIVLDLAHEAVLNSNQTGPRARTFDEVAGQPSLALGRSITYLPVSDDAKRKTLLGHGVPRWAFSATPRAPSPTSPATTR